MKLSQKDLLIKAILLIKEISSNISSGYNSELYLKIKKFLNENPVEIK